jgi:hypothetical protein
VIQIAWFSERTAANVGCNGLRHGYRAVARQVAAAGVALDLGREAVHVVARTAQDWRVDGVAHAGVGGIRNDSGLIYRHGRTAEVCYIARGV